MFLCASTYTKKRRSLYLLLVPRFEAFALPILPKRATQKPTPICIHTPCLHAGTHGYGMGMYKTYPQDIYRCLVFSKIRVCEVPNRQGQSVK